MLGGGQKLDFQTGNKMGLMYNGNDSDISSVMSSKRSIRSQSHF